LSPVKKFQLADFTPKRFLWSWVLLQYHVLDLWLLKPSQIRVPKKFFSSTNILLIHFWTNVVKKNSNTYTFLCVSLVIFYCLDWWVQIWEQGLFLTIVLQILQTGFTLSNRSPCTTLSFLILSTILGIA
jgi:hypothetical protein